MNARILVTPRSLTAEPHPEVERLRQKGFEIVYSTAGATPTEDELVTLVPDCVVAYKVTAYYSRENDHGFAWDDPDVGVEWPDVAAPGLLSAKDRDAPRLRDLPTYFAYED